MYLVYLHIVFMQQPQRSLCSRPKTTVWNATMFIVSIIIMVNSFKNTILIFYFSRYLSKLYFSWNFTYILPLLLVDSVLVLIITHTCAVQIQTIVILYCLDCDCVNVQYVATYYNVFYYFPQLPQSSEYLYEEDLCHEGYRSSRVHPDRLQ